MGQRMKLRRGGEGMVVECKDEMDEVDLDPLHG